MPTLFASYVAPIDAEKAAAALLDRGARQEDVWVIAPEAYGSARGQLAQESADRVEHEAKTGITTTTPADAAMGAAKGGTIGMGVGILAALAAITIPGVGLVLGAGVMATAVTGAIGTAIAGMAAGGVAGYLKDQGMGDDIAASYSNVVADGGAILAVEVPSNGLDSAEAESLLAKYNAVAVSTDYAPRMELDRENMTSGQPVAFEVAEVHTEGYVS